MRSGYISPGLAAYNADAARVLAAVPGSTEEPLPVSQIAARAGMPDRLVRVNTILHSIGSAAIIMSYRRIRGQYGVKTVWKKRS